MEVAALGLRVDGVENIERADKALKSLSESASTAEKSGGKLSKSNTAISQSNAKVAASSKATASAIAGVTASIKAQLVQIAKLSAATFGLTAVGRTLINFDGSMARVAAITRATTDELKAMRKASRDLGATTAFTASQ